MAILVAVFIFIMSSFPSEKIGGAIKMPIYTWETIVYHFVVFFALCFFLEISIVNGRFENKNLIFLAILLTVYYGISDEIHQLFVPGRVCDVVDVAIDSLGALAAGLLYSIKLKIKIY